MILGFGRLGSLAAQLGALFSLSSATPVASAYLSDFMRVEPVSRFIQVEEVGRFIRVGPVGRFTEVDR